MNLRYLFIAAVMGLSSISASAQEASNKSTVIVDFFYAGNGVRNNDLGWINMLRNDIVNELMSTGRVKVIDAASMTKLQYSPQAYNESSENSRLSTLRSNGATYVVQGDVEYIDINRIRLDNSKDYVYDARIGYNIRFIDANTGELLGQTIADPKDGSVHCSTPQKSMESVTGRAATAMRRILIDDISITGQVLELIDTKTTKRGEEAKTIAVNVGSDNGATRGVKFDVYVTHNIAGHKVSDKIGKVKITEVKGSDISYAQVKDGGVAILEAIHNGVKLSIKSSKAGFWD